MLRRDFLRASCLGCAGVMVGSGLVSLTGCSSLPMVKVQASGRELRVPLTAFAESAQVIVRSPELPYDLLLTKLPDGGARSVYLRCTHEDQPLTATATGLHCPSHGSRFALDGSVEEGPATSSLKTFPAHLAGDTCIINLGS